MKTKELPINKAMNVALFVLLLMVVGEGRGYAYDFSAVCSTGQTLYYNITNSTYRYVELTYPGTDGWHAWSDYTSPTGDIILPSSVSYGGNTYTIKAIGDHAFNGCNGLTGSLVIPNTVTSIGNNAFRNCRGFTGSLTIGNSVTVIGNFAFYYCWNFTGSLTIPNSVITIGDQAFHMCYRFNGSLTIGNSVTAIGAEAFEDCWGFTGSLTIGNSVTTIGEGAFGDCRNLTGNLLIPNSVTTIDAGAFSSCSGFTGGLTIPNTVTIIGNTAFSGCKGIESIIVASGNPYYDSRGNCNAIIEKSTNKLISGCKNAYIPNSVTTIGNSAFSNCGLTGSLTIPNSVTTIEDYAFSNCNELTGDLIIPNTVTSIGYGAFSYCSGFNGCLVLPNAITSIASSTFSDCSGLTGTLSIPSSVTSIGSLAFYNCPGLTGDLIIPNTVTTIEFDAFAYCSGFSGSLVVPNTLTTLGTDVFTSCSGFETITVEEGNPNYDSRENCNALIVTESNTLILGCKNSFIPDSITKIGDSAFSGCIGITGSLTIPNSVTSIGNYAFNNCIGLTGTLVIPNLVTSIGYNAFSGCSGITGDLVIPNSVTAIGNYAFKDCRSFTGLTLGESVATMSFNCFQGCEGLTSITSLAITPPSGYNVFYDVNPYTHVMVPCGSLEAYQNASGWSDFYNIQEDCGGTMYSINLTANPAEGGSVYGAGSYQANATCTVMANTNLDCIFNNWTEDGVVVSTEEIYSFTVTGNRNLVANITIEDTGNSIMVHDSTVTNSYVPVYGYYAEDYQKCEIVYPAEDLGEIIWDTITKLRFFAVQTNVGWCEPTFQVFLKEVDYTSISDFSGTENATLVYEGSLNITKGAMDIVFTTPYVYNGGNLLVGIYEIMPNYCYSNCTWYGETVEGASVQGYKTNSLDEIIPTQRNYIPKTRFYYNDGVQPDYTVTATANPTEGGTVTGGGYFTEGQTCTLTATANAGYTFTNWMENGTVVSTENPYTFTVTENRNLVASFVISGGGIIEGMLNGVFSVSDSTHVRFSQGNLQYIGSASTPYWKFAENQWDYLGNNGQGATSENVDRDLFGWGTSGYDHGAICYQPWHISNVISDTYYAYGDENYNLYDQLGQADWGYNPISNGGNTENLWRTLRSSEWDYLFNVRNTESGIRFAKAVVNGINGMILLPDNWMSSVYPINNPNPTNYHCHYNDNVINNDDWAVLEANDVVFLPAAGYRQAPNTITGIQTWAHYWSSTNKNASTGYNLVFADGPLYTSNGQSRFYGESVRLVRSVEDYSSIISATSNIENSGVVSEGGIYAPDAVCTLRATPNEGFAFVNWTENGTEISTEANYSFIVSGNRTLVANFVPSSGGAGMLNGSFSVSASQQVQFSKGNLQYMGRATTPYWKFADNQWDCFGSTTGQNSNRENVDRDLFGWGTSGWDNGNVFYRPYDTDRILSNDDIGYGYGPTDGTYYNYDLTGEYANADWGVYNAVFNGSNEANLWRTLTKDEWNYIFTERVDAASKYGHGEVNGVTGMILLPDDWTLPEGLSFTAGTNAWVNVYTSNEWAQMQANGAVFLPTAHRRVGISVDSFVSGYYWSSSHTNSTGAAYCISFSSDYLQPLNQSCARSCGESIRLVRSFESSTTYNINSVPNPSNGGTVTGGGNYSAGSTCTLTATANAGYTFTNWMENGVVVSTENPYTFTVTENRNLVANFIEVTDEDYWEVDAHAYAGTMSVNAIIQIDGVEQLRTDLEIGAFSGDECRGTMRPTDEYYYPDEMPHYFVFLTVHGDNGDPITFRLYDHSLHQELDLTCANTLTFSDNATIGDFDEPYAINFRNAITQTTDFRTGWNWWSSYVELDDIEGLAMLEEGLGEAGVQIKSQSKFAINYGSTWLGGLNAITNEQTLKVQVNAPVLVDLTGKPVSPADHPLTLNAGWNWIGYPSTNSLSVAEAFSNYTPVAGDQVKTQFSYAIYRPNIGWMGALRTINPGDGLFFYSTNGGTLIFPEGTRGSELADNLTADHNHWVPDMNAYPSNMTVMAVVELEDVELQSERYELAAFVNGEVRGSARLIYVEPMNRYMAFLTITGDEAADLHFGLYDTETGAECLESDDLLVFTADAMVGELESPMVVSFRGTTGLSDLERSLQVYPNPVNRGERAILTLPINAKAQIEVVNALGVVVETSRATSVQAPASPGVYTLRITVDGKGTISRKLVVK